MKAKTSDKASAKQIVLKPGQVVKIHQRIKEGAKERIQLFEGLIINLKGKKLDTQTFTVRKVVDGVGVEKIFPTVSEFIQKIEILREATVRRSNLSYVRSRIGKAARMKDEKIMDIVLGRTPKEEVTEENVVEAKEENLPATSPEQNNEAVKADA